MKFVKAIVVTGVAVAAMLGSGACSSKVHHDNTPQYVQQYDFDCDPGDYRQHDLDCGYYNNGLWSYYPWTSAYATSYPPVGWYPPAQVRTQFDQSHKVKNVPNPRYTIPQNRKTVAPKKTTAGYKAPTSNTKAPVYKAPTVPNKAAATRR